MKKYLITGGNGFIGANLVRVLLEKNKKVLVLTEPEPDLWRLESVRDQIGIIECNITDQQKVTQIVCAIKPDVIFHLAALGVKPANDGIKKLFDVNFFGTVNLLEACKNVGFDCFIATGTASEYGNKQELLKESLMLEPQDDYSISKAATTLYCQKEAKLHKLPIYIARPFCAYGNFEPSHRLIPTIINGYLKNKPISLSSPNNIRDFIYVKDIASGYLAIAEKRPHQETIFNIGTGTQHTTQQVVETFEKIVKTKLDIRWNKSQPRPWELGNWQANIQQAKDILGWAPAHTLKSGLEKTLYTFYQKTKSVRYEPRSTP
ncbi:SDR family NAD(P)-dependent oxidoreductase [Candidatus Dependentiae bacterium]|nr:SDR family NAD(P)-dependent oxidoreductase [Candidatus Dependentiae bacterium]